MNHQPAAAAAVLLSIIAVQTALSRQSVTEADPYHARIRQVAGELPFRLGDWVGTDIEVPAAAVAMLEPNAMVCRRFQNVRTGREVIFLFVQCGDARDLLGHYPPVCYPARGWHLLNSQSTDWVVDQRTILGTTYEFARESIGSSIPIIIDNFMVVPAGGTARDMDQVNRAAQNSVLKWFGAAQIQVISSGDMPVEMRRAIVEELIHGHANLIAAVIDETGVQN